MDMDWNLAATMVGLVGITLVISGSNVLPDFRGWCMGFENRRQPLRWLGYSLEFIGIVTDKSMAAAFLLGLWWWSGLLPWGDVFVLSGTLTLLAAVADEGFAFMHAVVRRTMGGGAPPPPMSMPQGSRLEELENELPKPKGPLTEEDAFRQLDNDDEGADHDRGASIKVN